MRGPGSRPPLGFGLGFVAAATVAALLACAAPASAVDWSLRFEPGAAGPLEKPQRSLFGPGGAAAARLALGPASFLDLQLAVALVGLSAASSNPDTSSGFAWSVGGGIRFKRPRTASTVVHPWIDGDLSYVHTGDLSRFGFSLGAGLGFVVDKKRVVQLGPFVRYVQIVEPARTGYDDTDAKVLIGGLSIEFSSPPPAPARGLPGDRDGDGIPDATDKCPDLAEDRDGFEHQDGCPDLDNDKDGIPDALDKCPNQPEDKDGFQDQDGCPDPDNDGDGVPDAVDKCPSQAEDKDGFEDQDGCPDLDNDKDGIPDADDGCPNQPGTKETGGCPDHDGDGIGDGDDLCPDVPGPAENHGCPAYKNVKITENKLELAQKIFFAHDLTRILPRSYPLLDEVAQVLKDHAALHVRIEGHTDSRGSVEHNRQLSQGRAQAVRDYLVARGISIARLDARGYGSELPIDSNATVDGRENNRRVEFVIVKEGPK